MDNIIIKVEGMKCEGCEKTIKNSLMQIQKIDSVIPNYKEGKVYIKKEKSLDKSLIKEKIEQLGFIVKE